MQTLHSLLNTTGRVLNRHQGKIYGFLPAIVTKLNDTKKNRHMQGYLQVFFPTLQLDARLFDPGELEGFEGQEGVFTAWARFSTPAAGGGAGVYQFPQIGDEVLCAFEQGDPHHPYVLGHLFNGVAPIPSPAGTDPNDSMSGGGGSNCTQFWKSRTGNCISLSDKKGEVVIQDRSGNSCIKMNDSSITISQSSKDIRCNASTLVCAQCTDFTVNAKKTITLVTPAYEAVAGNNYSVGAKSTITHIGLGAITHTAGANYAANASEQTELQSLGGNITMTSGAEINISSAAKKAAVESKGAMTFTSAVKVIGAGPSGTLVKAGGLMTIMAGAKIVFNGGSSAKLNCGGGGGFSLFGAIVNAIKSAAVSIVSSAVSAANAVAGAVVQGASLVARGVAAAGAAVGRLAGAAASAVGRAASAVCNAVADGARAVGNAVAGAARAAVQAGAAVGRAVANTARAAASAVQTAANYVTNAARSAVETAGRVARQAGEAVVQGARNVAERVQQGMQTAANTVRNAAEAAVNTFQRATESVAQAAQQAVQGARNVAEGAVQAVQGAVNTARETCAQVVNDVRTAAGQAVERVQTVGGQVVDGARRIATAVGEVPGRVVEAGRQVVDRGRHAVADGLERAADVIRPGGGSSGLQAGRALDHGSGRAQREARPTRQAPEYRPRQEQQGGGHRPSTGGLQPGTAPNPGTRSRSGAACPAADPTQMYGSRSRPAASASSGGGGGGAARSGGGGGGARRSRRAR